MERRRPDRSPFCIYGLRVVRPFRPSPTSCSGARVEPITIPPWGRAGLSEHTQAKARYKGIPRALLVTLLRTSGPSARSTGRLPEVTGPGPGTLACRMAKPADGGRGEGAGCRMPMGGRVEWWEWRGIDSASAAHADRRTCPPTGLGGRRAAVPRGLACGGLFSGGGRRGWSRC
jgi:hypothetical protein